uniref:FBD domain-containing protein n=1 Tax=Arundo donax TaxID=35708 RepID=A0A0A9C4S5_ARUDO
MDRPKDEAAIIFDMGFPSLEQLYFWCGRNTPLYMRFLPGVLPKLRHLEIYFDEWEWGGTTPDGMEPLLGLRSMEVYMCFRCDEGGKSQYRRATDSRAGCAFMNATQVHPRHPALSMHYIPLTRGASPPLFVW